MLAGALVQLPAIWVVGAIVVAAFGLSPRLSSVGWFALAVFLLLGEVGPVVGLDRRVIDLSPFTKHEVSGPGAEAWLDGLVANKVPTRIGRIALCHALARRGGGIRCCRCPCSTPPRSACP